MRKRLGLLVLVTVVLGASALVVGSIGAEGKPKTPKRVLIVLFDQMRPEYADRFDMTNFKKLRGEGTSFDKAYLGYMGSETVIAHNVITSGQLPKHMGWVDEGYRDANDLLGKGTDAMHITGDLTMANFTTLIDNEGYPKLSDYLQLRARERSSSPSARSPTPSSRRPRMRTHADRDIAVRMSSRKNRQSVLHSTSATTGTGSHRARTYRRTSIDSTNTTTCQRFQIDSDSGNDYGTKTAFPSFMYPEDGNRFVPGTDSAHLGGDTWVADAAMAMMENEDVVGDVRHARRDRQERPHVGCRPGQGGGPVTTA